MAERGARREVEALAAERDFLLASLEDLEREHDAGDVDEADYTALRSSYVERTAATLRALEADEVVQGPVPGASTRRPRRLRRYLGRSRTRRALLGGAALCLLAALVTLALSLAGVRLPGQGATGSVNIPANETVAQQLSAASVLGSEGEFTQALSLYGAVLAKQPHNAEALTYRSWLIRLIGVAGNSSSEVRSADSGLAEAVQVAPGYPPARAFYGIALLEDQHNPSVAEVQFQAYLADKPTASIRTAFGAEIAQAFLQSRVRVPKSFVAFIGSITGTTDKPAG